MKYYPLFAEGDNIHPSQVGYNYMSNFLYNSINGHSTWNTLQASSNLYGENLKATAEGIITSITNNNITTFLLHSSTAELTSPVNVGPEINNIIGNVAPLNNYRYSDPLKLIWTTLITVKTSDGNYHRGIGTVFITKKNELGFKYPEALNNVEAVLFTVATTNLPTCMC